MRFLKSVDLNRLGSVAFAYTLTLRDVPSSHDDFKKMVDSLRKGIYRRGAKSDHWVIEWTKVGRPHLHGVVYLDDDVSGYDFQKACGAISRHWLSLTAHLGTLERGQHIVPISTNLGWFQYMAKHASRGMAHYQREKGSLPKGWEKTGRMWGKGGDWPVSETSYNMNNAAYYSLRRLVKNYLLGQNAKDIGRAKRFQDFGLVKSHTRRRVYLRGMLRNPDPVMSQVRGLNEWVPENVLREMLAHLVSANEWTNLKLVSDDKQTIPDPSLTREQHFKNLTKKRNTDDQKNNTPDPYGA
jgi:hypothetical protein